MQSIKKITKKDFAQLKNFDMIGRKTALSIRLERAVFCRCKKYICKKMLHEGKIRIYREQMKPVQIFVFVNFSFLLERDVIKHGLDAFCNWWACLLNEKIWLNELMFNGAQKCLPRGTVNNSNPQYLGYKHHLKIMGSCVSPCMSTEFERVDCLQTKITKPKCRKIYSTHIQCCK